MCGGGGSRATITMPDTAAYQQQFNLQRAAVEQQINGGITLQQNELQSALRRKEALLTEAANERRQKADDSRALSEEAMRLSTLIGTPPPEKSAKAPTIGAEDRRISRTKGKAGLRIGRATAGSYGQGAGLNIT